MPHAAGQTPTPAGAPYVLKVGEQYVTLADFDHIFRKNNRDGAATVESLDAYMELFINFKLKLAAGAADGAAAGGETTASSMGPCVKKEA